MKPFWESEHGRIFLGDCLDVLKALPDESVNMCVTSPPYYGLRDYGTATWEGGDPNCEHVGSIVMTKSGGDGKQYTNIGSNRVFSGDCKCGAKRIDNQIGLEETPEAYIDRLVAVFREVKRVLKNDSTLWINIADSYAGGGRGFGYGGKQDANKGCDGMPKSIIPNGCKPKDLIGIPWMLAFALRADGWWLRSDIIWSKPSCMPESILDRPTRSHEYIFLLSKNQKYYYNADAIKEPIAKSTATDSRLNKENYQIGRPERGFVGSPSKGSGLIVPLKDRENRNKRSVWTVTTKPYKEAHFATFPEKLIEPCILAGCPKGGTVLDPFGGAMTTAKVAFEHNRRFVMIELNEKYIQLGIKRIERETKQMRLF